VRTSTALDRLRSGIGDVVWSWCDRFDVAPLCEHSAVEDALQYLRRLAMVWPHEEASPPMDREPGAMPCLDDDLAPSKPGLPGRRPGLLERLIRHWLRELPSAQAAVVVEILRGGRLRQIARARGTTPQAVRNLLDRALRTARRGGPYRQREGFMPQGADPLLARHPPRWTEVCRAWARGASYAGIARALECSLEAVKRLCRRIREAERRESGELVACTPGALAPV
jgi:DNA-directed RNA polymerase specialized sigma24 family protein